MYHDLNYQYPFNCTWGPANFCSISFTLAIFTLLLLVWTVNLHLWTAGFCMCNQVHSTSVIFCKAEAKCQCSQIKKKKKTSTAFPFTLYYKEGVENSMLWPVLKDLKNEMTLTNITGLTASPQNCRLCLRLLIFLFNISSLWFLTLFASCKSYTHLIVKVVCTT